MFEAKTLKSIILFAKEQRIMHFKYKDFEFDLSDCDPTANQLAEMQAEIDALKALTNKLHLAQSFKKVG
jgi:hypothetical protein